MALRVIPIEQVLLELDGDSGMTRPLRGYIDTAGFQDLATDQADQRIFLRASHAGILRPALSRLHLLEFSKKSPLLRATIGSLLDSIEKCILWIRTSMELQSREWHRVAATGGDGRLEDSEVFFGGEELLRGRSISQIIEFLASLSKTEYFRLADEWLAASRYRQERRQSMSPVSRRYKPIEIAARIAHTLPPDMTLRELAALEGRQIPCERMPANRIRVAYEEGTELDNSALARTDIEDAYHLGSAVYCHLAFVDKKTRARLDRALYCAPHIRKNIEFPNLLSILRCRIP